MNPVLYLDRQLDRTLSGGERKRIELASLLTIRPRLAILDEPDSGIDMLSTAAIAEVIRSFRETALPRCSSPTGKRLPAWPTGPRRYATAGSSSPALPGRWLIFTGAAAVWFCNGWECGHV